MSIGPLLAELQEDEVEKSSLEISIIFFCYYVNFHGFSRKWIFQNLIFQVYPIITPLIMDQMTCSLPKNVTTFHGKEDGIIHFCLRPHKRGVLALWIYILTKKIIDFPKLDFSSSSYHNFINIGPSDMFFTRKCIYFSQKRRWKFIIRSSIFVLSIFLANNKLKLNWTELE